MDSPNQEKKMTIEALLDRTEFDALAADNDRMLAEMAAQQKAWEDDSTWADKAWKDDINHLPAEPPRIPWGWLMLGVGIGLVGGLALSVLLVG